MLKEGAESRIRVVRELFASLGGSIEAAYWAFGDDDFIAIGELPDNAAAAAMALTVSGSGAATVTTVVLLTPEEIDTATRTGVRYTPPGQ